MSDTAEAMTLAAAHEMIRRGVEYGTVYLAVAEADRADLKAWFLRASGVPNLAARTGARVSAPTGDACARCGGMLVRTGTCLTCQGCGDSSGGCG